jgi:hypothetical protein
MPSSSLTFDAEVWIHEGGDGGGVGWHFLSVPTDIADDLEAEYGHRAAGFGSLRVSVSIGTSRWETSLFPDSKRGTYVLPLKKAVRVAEGLTAGTTAAVELTVLA